MPNREQENPPPQADASALVKQAQPLIQMVAMVCAILIWSYNTFALKETVQELKVMVASVEVRCNNYSDNNRHRMEEQLSTIMVDIRDQLNYLRSSMIKHKGD